MLTCPSSAACRNRSTGDTPGRTILVRWYHGKLEEKGIITAPREGLVRFSPHYYNDDSEVERVIDALKSLLVA